MEKITLNNRQLDFLASHDPVLEPFFFGTVPCDKLPRHPDKSNPTGYIVNTDPDTTYPENIGSHCGQMAIPVKSWTVTPYL